MAIGWAGRDRSRTDTVWPLLSSVAVGIAVVGPLARKGYLLLLDWSPGRHLHLPATFFGLGGGLLSGLGYTALTVAAGALAPAAVGWLPLAVFFPLAGVGMARLVPGRVLARTAGALLFIVNPLVLDRAFAGQFGFLLGYALLPWFTRSLLAAGRSSPAAAGTSRLKRVLPAAWLIVMTALSPHFAWLGGVVVVAWFIGRGGRRADLLWGLATLGVAAVGSAYLVAMISAGHGRSGAGVAELVAFRTRGGSPPSLGLNLVGLSGFWRADPRVLRLRPAGWPAVLAAVLLIIGLGLRTWWNKLGKDALGITLIVSGGAGFFLATGDRGPTGWLFKFAYMHVPGFAVMREPQKFIALLAMAYAVFFGLGVAAVVDAISLSWVRVGVAGVLLSAPLLGTPGLLDGLGGAVHPSRYPRSWYQADAIMGTGAGKILVLPWHEYLPLSWTGGRQVASPAGSFFRRDMVASDNVDLPGVRSPSDRSRYLEFLLAHGADTRTFGQLVAPIGVEYVLVLKTADWSQYAWLAQQQDLTEVMGDDDLVLFRNRRPVSDGARVSGVVDVADWGEVMGLAAVANLDNVAVRVRRVGPGPIRAPVPMPSVPSGGPLAAVHRDSATRYGVGGGSDPYVQVAVPYDPGWRLGGTHPQELASGATGFPVGSGAQTLEFKPWAQVRIGLGISVAVMFCLALAAFVDCARVPIPAR